MLQFATLLKIWGIIFLFQIVMWIMFIPEKLQDCLQMVDGFNLLEEDRITLMTLQFAFDIEIFSDLFFYY